MPQEDENSEIMITFLRKELEASLEKNASLEKENHELRREVSRLRDQITSLKAYNHERKTVLWKKFQNSMDTPEQSPAAKEKMSPKLDFTEEKPATTLTNAPPPKPPPTPPASFKEVKGNKGPSAPAPPPPPPPSKSLVGSKGVRRVPEVIELYRSLTRKDPHMENKANPAGVHVFALTKNMIGEIENRSSYVLAIKSEVETQAEFINFLIGEVESATFKNIADVEAFVNWLDRQLSSLVDERAVLKHFPQWPERKADTLREAACNYRDLRNLKSEVSSFEDSMKEPLILALRRIEALQDRQACMFMSKSLNFTVPFIVGNEILRFNFDRLERSLSSTERTRDITSKKYRDFQIPWEWMLDTGLIGQLKVSSLRLAKEFMKRIIKEVQSSECSRVENLLLQGVRFAFRVHQFAGGFDSETIISFEELKKIGTDIKRQTNKQ
ncbi:INCREASED PETAL GROWTH ANISOTROPY 1-like protein 1 isoform X1 [Rosa rugosa]|uniref:INCREASED PETAL GROWTH ANISOTROPY 1-like protein 1 isoform X1 n=1 Tax=Rosa rugosa TaxID=74645 RepID=UPI002B404415|nr:INCREASED PETAL GROWTH ANISOTROPY 1-like protein 1 isoform X1 [Rosa rugosa]